MKIRRIRRPRSILDPTGMGAIVKSTLTIIDTMFRRLTADIEYLIPVVSQAREGSTMSVYLTIPAEQSVVNEDQTYELSFTPSLNVNYASDLYAQLSSDVQDLVEKWLGVPLDRYNFFMEQPLKEAANLAATTTQADLATMSEVYAEQRPLYRIVFENTYLNRLNFIQQNTYDMWKGFTEQMKADLRYVLSQGVLEGVSTKQLRSLIADRLNVGRSRAKRIAQTELLRVYRQTTLAEAKDTRERLGLDTAVLHISALKETTRRTHAERHGRIYSIEEEQAFYATGSNNINCYCKPQIVVRQDVDPDIIETYTKQRKKWLQTR